MTAEEYAMLLDNINAYEETWDNAEDYLRDIALSRLGVDTIEEYVNPMGYVLTLENTEWIEECEWLWDDAISVLQHAEHELSAAWEDN